MAKIFTNNLKFVELKKISKISAEVKFLFWFFCCY